MKRILALSLVILLVCVCFVACEAEQSTPHVHEYADADCKQPQKCSCGATLGEALNNHSFANGVCTVCQKEMIDELGRIARNDNDKKDEQDLTPLFSVQSGDSRGDIESISASSGESFPSKQDSTVSEGYSVTLTLTQEGLLSGTYSWRILRSVYVKDGNYYDNSYMFGTIKASEFSENAELTLTDNGNYKEFDDSEKSEYLDKVSHHLDLIIKERLTALLTDNESGLTVADLGFANYK